MSEVFLTSPKEGDEERELFERSYAKGDLVMTSQLRVDATLRRVRNAVTDSSEPIDLNGLETVVEAHLATALKKTTYEKSPSIIDYFHLKIKHALVKQIIFAYPLFKQREKYTERRELANGVYGTVSEILEEALLIYDSATDNERDQLTGIINELTVLALLNRRQVPEQLAIPSDTTSDLFNATDLELFVLRKGQANPSTYHIQVKTRSRSGSKVRMPADGILINAKNICNQSGQSKSFPTSRAIVAEVNAIDSEEQTNHLAIAIKTLEERINIGMKKSDTFRQAIDSLPEELQSKLDGVMKAVRGIINQALKDSPEATDIIIEIPED